MEYRETLAGIFLVLFFWIGAGIADPKRENDHSKDSSIHIYRKSFSPLPNGEIQNLIVPSALE